jgi:hypothetical protein
MTRTPHRKERRMDLLLETAAQIEHDLRGAATP